MLRPLTEAICNNRVGITDILDYKLRQERRGENQTHPDALVLRSDVLLGNGAKNSW